MGPCGCRIRRGLDGASLAAIDPVPSQGEIPRTLRIDLERPRQISVLRLVVETANGCYRRIDAVGILPQVRTLRRFALRPGRGVSPCAPAAASPR